VRAKLVRAAQPELRREVETEASTRRNGGPLVPVRAQNARFFGSVYEVPSINVQWNPRLHLVSAFGHRLTEAREIRPRESTGRGLTGHRALTCSTASKML